ncbi:MAG TPA: hypothetical protein VN754_15565 [Candidatus Binataceae bacterium]|nr:hypothetical protein [Candidatus Binataceae bacterium]
MGSTRCRLAIASLAVALAIPLSAFAQTGGDQPPTTGGPQVAQPEGGGVNWKGAGVGAATLLANVGYIPAKTVYAIVGGITGGMGYALTLGNQRTANSIWRSSLGGDYVLTPEMVSGQAPIHFSGQVGSPAAGYPQPESPQSSASTQQLSSNTAVPPPAAAPAPVYPNTPASTGSGTSLGAPPYSASVGHSARYGSSSIGSTHITTSIVSEPADSGAGPVH